MRSSGELSHRTRVNQVVGYILAHLDEPLSADTLAGIACLSRYHFHRIFLATTGLTPAEYVEYARMNAVVNALRSSQETITTIASSVGFESGAALAKAMRRRYGLAPSDLRKACAHPETEASNAFDIRAFIRPKTRTKLKPRIEVLPRQSVLCATEFGMENNSGSEAHQRAIARVQRVIESHNLSSEITAQIMLLPDAPKGPNDPSFRSVAGFTLNDLASRTLDKTDLQLETIGGGRHAVFSHKAPISTVWQTWFAIHHDWFPASEFRRRDQVPFQSTGHIAGRDLDTPYCAEIYIPIE